MYAVDSNNQFQRVSHMGHELAHPLGSGFSEWVIKGQINYGRLFCRIGNTFVKIDRPEIINFLRIRYLHLMI